ncbi:unnamed protein product [Boreogadus saida]
MKRSGDSEAEKRRKRRKLLHVLGDTKIPYLGPSDGGFQHLWDSSYSGLVLRPSCSLPTELHGRVQAALSTLRTKGCLLRDLVRVRDRDVFTSVSRALLGQPGHTYRYLDTRLFAIPWHMEEGGGGGGAGGEEAKAGSPRCCDPDMRAACQALWALNSFFCTDVPRREPEERLDLFIKAEGVVGKGAEPAEDGESKHSGDSKRSEGGGSRGSRQSEEDGGGTGESKHSDEWDLESRHSDEGCCPGAGPGARWETESKHSSEGEGGSSQAVPGPSKAGGSKQCPTWTLKTGESTEAERGGAKQKPVTDLKRTLCDYHIEDEEEEEEQEEEAAPPTPPGRCTAPPQFNVTLLNFMDPAAMRHLKEEPYYGMGKMAVGWHHDENLIAQSPVAVYSYSCHGDAGEDLRGLASF